MLTIDQLTKHFKSKRVLHDVSLHVAQGEIVSLLGRSGSGKSTLLNLIAGFERAEAGSIALGGAVLSGEGKFVDPSQRSIGFVFQNYALFPHLSVSENIGFGIIHLSKGERRERIEKLLSLINLEGYGDKYPDTLSGGEQQRVALARVLATEPSVILFDEPFSNVDTVLKTSIRNDLMGILRSSGATAVFVTHDPHEAMAISDRIAYIDEGKIIQFDTPEALYHSPINENIAAFFGPINRYKDGFVRVEKCRISEQGIECRVILSHFSGRHFETKVSIVVEGYLSEFMVYTDSKYAPGSQLFIEIQ